MPKFSVTYECPNPKCGYTDTLTVDTPTIAAAWKTASTPCPAHELSGDCNLFE